MITPPRRLDQSEIDALLASDVPARPAADPRAGVCVDVEERERADGERPNREVRATGEAELFDDRAGEWTRRIRAKYLSDRPASSEHPRVVIRLRPHKLIAVASV
jgi:hypothetical protein